MTDIARFGRYVVPFDQGGAGPPRGFVFDGDSCVIDLDLPTAARHDWDYLCQRGFWRSNWRYFTGLAKDKRPLWALIRYVGLTGGGWVAYCNHGRRNRREGLAVRIAERIIPHAQDDGVWVWPLKTWLLADLRRAPTPGAPFDERQA